MFLFINLLNKRMFSVNFSVYEYIFKTNDKPTEDPTKSTTAKCIYLTCESFVKQFLRVWKVKAQF